MSCRHPIMQSERKRYNCGKVFSAHPVIEKIEVLLPLELHALFPRTMLSRDSIGCDQGGKTEDRPSLLLECDCAWSPKTSYQRRRLRDAYVGPDAPPRARWLHHVFLKWWKRRRVGLLWVDGYKWLWWQVKRPNRRRCVFYNIALDESSPIISWLSSSVDAKTPSISTPLGSVGFETPCLACGQRRGMKNIHK